MSTTLCNKVLELAQSLPVGSEERTVLLLALDVRYMRISKLDQLQIHVDEEHKHRAGIWCNSKSAFCVLLVKPQCGHRPLVFDADRTDNRLPAKVLQQQEPERSDIP